MPTLYFEKKTFAKPEILFSIADLLRFYWYTLDLIHSEAEAGGVTPRKRNSPCICACGRTRAT